MGAKSFLQDEVLRVKMRLKNDSCYAFWLVRPVMTLEGLGAYMFV